MSNINFINPATKRAVKKSAHFKRIQRKKYIRIWSSVLPVILVLLGVGFYYRGTIFPQVNFTEQQSVTTSKIMAGRATVPTEINSWVPPETTEKENETAEEFSGLSKTVYAKNISRPISLSFGSEGELYATSADGHIFIIRSDENEITNSQVFFTGLDSPIGIAYHNNQLYVSSKATVSILADTNDNDLVDYREDILTGLPVGARQTLGLEFRNSALYIAQGATSTEVGEEGKIMRILPDGKNVEPFASGFYNPFAIAFHPLTGDLFVVDSVSEGDDKMEELNLVTLGGDYGWPNCNGLDCTKAKRPLLTFPAGTEVRGLTFYTGNNLPKEYFHNLFVVLSKKSEDGEAGQEIVRVKLTRKSGLYEAEVLPFIDGFTEPVDIIEGPDGALYVSDYGANEIIKIFAK
ncbi:MAG: PQQ-dependent sugar dehydrogenase [bacterium]